MFEWCCFFGQIAWYNDDVNKRGAAMGSTKMEEMKMTVLAVLCAILYLPFYIIVKITKRYL